MRYVSQPVGLDSRVLCCEADDTTLAVLTGVEINQIPPLPPLLCVSKGSEHVPAAGPGDRDAAGLQGSLLGSSPD